MSLVYQQCVSAVKPPEPLPRPLSSRREVASGPQHIANDGRAPAAQDLNGEPHAQKRDRKVEGGAHVKGNTRTPGRRHLSRLVMAVAF